MLLLVQLEGVAFFCTSNIQLAHLVDVACYVQLVHLVGVTCYGQVMLLAQFVDVARGVWPCVTVSTFDWYCM